MEIEKAKELRVTLEMEIFELITQFEHGTQLHVSEVSLKKVETENGDKKVIDIDVEIEL